MHLQVRIGAGLGVRGRVVVRVRVRVLVRVRVRVRVRVGVGVGVGLAGLCKSTCRLSRTQAIISSVIICACAWLGLEFGVRLGVDPNPALNPKPAP